MYSKKDLQKAKELIEDAKRIALFLHISPDLDSVASNLAMSKVIQSLSKNVVIFSEDNISDLFSWILQEQKISPINDFFVKDFDLVIFLDANEIHRFSSDSSNFSRILDKAIVIDHHSQGKEKFKINIIDNTENSTSEILYKFFRFCDWEITKSIARFLFIGIVGDTGWFHFGVNSISKSLAVASSLIEINDCTEEVSYSMSGFIKPSYINLWKIVLDKVKFDEGLGLLSVFITKKDLRGISMTEEDASGARDVIRDRLLRSFHGYDIIAFMREKDDVISGSVRSTLGSVDVSKVCGLFEIGGGHPKASGFQTKRSYDSVMRTLREGIIKYRL